VLKQQLDDARQSQERLASELRALKGPGARPSIPQPEPETNPIAPVEPHGLHYSPPDQVDDLQQIRGIGEGFERGLNRLGIYRLSQLAGLSAAEIVWLENSLPTFRGRVEREDWPAQAAALMAAGQPGDRSLRGAAESAKAPGIN
jgi:predicted flap endonuclease-1-like 5' DNA nuclease